MKEIHTNETAYADPGHEAAEESGEEALNRLAARYNMPRAVCMEMIADVLEVFADSHNAGPACEADGDQLRRLNSLNAKAWRYLIEYQSNQKTADEVRMSTRAMALELGFKTAAVGMREPTVAELARICHFDKQTVNKCAMNFQKLMDLARREGQRGDAARANMSEARIKQITK
jgi:hypothetical protein